MIAVYIDSVFLLNTLVDAIILLATAHLAGIPPERGRFFLASVFGGVYAAAVFLPGCEWLSCLPAKAAVGLMMVLTAFGCHTKCLRLLFLFLGVSCAMAGCVMAVGMIAGGIPMENGIFYTDLDAGVLLVTAAAAYVVLSFVFRATAENSVKGNLIPVTLAWGERQIRLTALCDTGNALKDPATGRPILIVDSRKIRELIPGDIRPILTQDALRTPADLPGRLGEHRVRFRLIPYQAVGVAGGMLLAIRLDWGEVGGKRYDRLVAALSPTELGEGFAALWGEMERSGYGGNCARQDRQAEKTAGTAGAFAAAERSLYWRK